MVAGRHPSGSRDRRNQALVNRPTRWLCVVLAGWPALQAVAEITPQDAAFFEAKVRPVLVERCFDCHSHEKKIKGGLVLDSRGGWEKGGETGPAIVPGKPDESLLIQAIRHTDQDLQMPPRKKLRDEEIAVLTEWVQRGAPDPRTIVHQSGADLEEGRKHWAFQPLTNPPIPAPAFSGLSTAPIDAFIFSALAQQGLQPAAWTDRATLLRRATYDLTGLPPTAEETMAFLHDRREETAAFADVVDRLLASPAYGEKWGRFWLDLAHYADTTGCSSDWPIDDLWRYRDWVVTAFNEDKPFDEFLTEQLAGDLLAVDQLEQPGELNEKIYRDRIVATGFLATAKRFGSDPGGYDHLTIGDSLDTTWKALQGLTVGCARCHDHKFDPIKASDYYALYGILASSLYPYSGAEKNPNAALLVPLDRPAKATCALDTWNRELPAPGLEPKPRSILASFGHRWGFEDHETSEQVADRAPVNPWLSTGGVTVRDGNSPFTHLLPKGIKLVDFQATTPHGEMTRRVRWLEERHGVRSIAIDLQLTSLWEPSAHRLKLVWRSPDEPGRELELATIGEQGLTAPSPDGPIALKKEVWYHLTLTYALEASILNVQLWSADGTQVADLQRPCTAAAALRGPGDLAIRFETDRINNRRQGCVRVDNLVAESDLLPPPAEKEPDQLAQTTKPPATGAEQGLADTKKAVETRLANIYQTVLPKKPETAFALWEGTPHDVAIQKRGEPGQPGARVARRNLLLFGGQPVEHPDRESGRRDLARWLLDETNPLTLRVFVNRLWQWHFGRGLVASSNDFGHQGERPTHPELLDYLVQRFRANRLSVKAMQREIMLSHTYRQSSTPNDDSRQRDPDNRWLAHFSPRRLLAEEIRDATLAVSGLLDRNGAGYHQPFPALNQRGWNQHYPFSLAYEAQYPAYEHRKRSIYLPVVRLVADPFLSTFDGADSNQSVAQRGETAVPLQALALLNAPFLVEAAHVLGAQADREAGDEDAVRRLHRQIFGIEANPAVQSRLLTRLTAMKHEAAIPRREALALIAQALIGSNSFLYVF